MLRRKEVEWQSRFGRSARMTRCVPMSLMMTAVVVVAVVVATMVVVVVVVTAVAAVAAVAVAVDVVVAKMMVTMTVTMGSKKTRRTMASDVLLIPRSAGRLSVLNSLLHVVLVHVLVGAQSTLATDS